MEFLDFACILLPHIDYDSQLRAIGALLDLHRQNAKRRSEAIQGIERELPHLSGVQSNLANDERVESYMGPFMRTPHTEWPQSGCLRRLSRQFSTMHSSPHGHTSATPPSNFFFIENWRRTRNPVGLPIHLDKGEKSR